MIDVLESVVKFLASYPVWARVVVGTGLTVAVFTLLLAPRNSASGRPEISDDQAWLIIRGVDLYGRYPRSEVRVTANVNGTSYIYPTLPGVEWLEVGPVMASQQFKLPRPGRNGYEIWFEMLIRDPGYVDDVMSMKSVQSTFVTIIPHDGEYLLHKVDGGVRGRGVEAAVHFSITRDPNS